MSTNLHPRVPQESGVEDFTGNFADIWIADRDDSGKREWAYTNSAQNEDDLFLFHPSVRKTDPLRLFRERCQATIAKLMHSHR